MFSCTKNIFILAASFSLLRSCLARKLPDSSRLQLSPTTEACPCTDKKLCRPVQRRYTAEVFGFDASSWQYFDWSVVTTIAWAGDNPDLLCKAHQEGVRLIAGAPFPIPLTANATARRVWINATLASVQQRFLDGITFDYESSIARNSPNRDLYTTIVAETTAAFHAADPGYQVSVCVAWSPDNIDGRDYDYSGLAHASDLLYMMVYDTRSQIYGRCIASANSPLVVAQRGVQRFLDFGVSPSKLVLGIPWYGYTYPCLNISKDGNDDYCAIKEVPFRGVNCSDAAGSEISYSKVMAILDSGNSTTGRRWDTSTMSPYFNYFAEDGTLHQIWYDDPESLGLKYRFAREMGLRGTGPYTYDDLDNDGSQTGNPKAKQEAGDMWKALHVFSDGKNKYQR
ncbi:hypothetical protein CYMTET_54689 [Cymbomonas tetramitiformis]|uniref:GH18 domain-containing protein n=1 Tax=Cymbomonas tetramitiformis TaxID=36881 RepID=A0AAE0BFM2_9CHLO|nr:hypothetical protein CYMTET_54689 [Cymbomonas tetramitiformis]